MKLLVIRKPFAPKGLAFGVVKKAGSTSRQRFFAAIRLFGTTCDTPMRLRMTWGMCFSSLKDLIKTDQIVLVIK